MNELEFLRRWNRWLGVGCVILALGVVALTMGVLAFPEREAMVAKRAYSRGLEEGTTMKNEDLHKAYMAGVAGGAIILHGGVLVQAAPTGRENRGPLDLSGFTPEQIAGLHCYLQDPPGGVTGLP